MLNGYDPLKEHNFWHWLSEWATLGMYIALGLWFVGKINSLFLDIYTSGSSITGCLLSLVSILLSISVIIAAVSKREKTRRTYIAQRRQEALEGAAHSLTIPQPLEIAAPGPLPWKLLPRRRPFGSPTFSGMLSTFIVLLILALPVLFGFNAAGQLSLLDVSFIVVAFVAFLCTLAAIPPALHPELEIREDGITARYGDDTLTISWENVRYFALLGSNKKQMRLPAIYELSDGENMITWRDTPAGYTLAIPFAQSSQIAPKMQTAIFLHQHLPELVTARTGRPLLDLRR